jgi:hypothetical protein
LTIIPSHGMSWITPKRDTMCKWNCGLSKLSSTNGHPLRSAINAFQRYKTTHPEVTPHSLKSLKHFAKFMAQSIEGVLDPDGMPTVQTVRNYFRCFASGWNIDNPKSLISTDSITNAGSPTLQYRYNLPLTTK